MSWFTSPLAATAVVCAVMAGLSIPLHHLTGGRAEATDPRRAAPVAAPAAPAPVARLHLRLLAAATFFELRTPDGTVLWTADALAAGEHEHELPLPIHDGRIEMLVDADFGDHEPDTALFLTVVPDGLQEQTRHAIGSGRIEELLDFQWPTAPH